MSASRVKVLQDTDLLEMLRDEPELLAIADALVQTHERETASEQPASPLHRLRIGRAASLAAAALLVSLATALFLISPWQGSVPLVQRALAAVGTRPVLHLVTEEPAPQAATLIDIATGQAIPRVVRTEVWFDQQRELKKVVTTLDGKTLGQSLETPQGGWTESGPIYTCAWIAAHPVEATKAHVSCSASGGNGTVPRVVPEQPPTLDQALGDFVDRYQAALASGAAKQVGSGQLNGRNVIWLQFDVNGSSERVAVDAATYRPLAIEENGTRTSVVTAETIPYDPRLFTRPPFVEGQSGGGSISVPNLTTPSQAASMLGGRALWLGDGWHGLRLVQVRSGTVRVARDIVPVVDFTYAETDASGNVDASSQIEIYETRSCVVNVGWTCTPRDPTTSGELGVRGPIALLKDAGLYVSVWDWAVSTTRALDIARALAPLDAS